MDKIETKKWLKKITVFLIYLDTVLFSLYFFRFGVGWVRTNVFEVGVLLSVILGASYLYLAKKKPQLGFLWPYLFLLVALIAVFLSPDKIKALGIFKGWFFIPIAYYWLVINFFHNGSRISNLGRVLAIPLAFICLWSILQYYGVIGPLFYQAGDVSFTQYLEQGRIFGPFESPNYLAMFVVPVFFLALLPFNKKKIPFYFLLFLLAGATLYLSDSRSGTLAMAGGLMTGALLWPVREKFLIIFKVALLAAVIWAVTGVTSKIDLESGSNKVRREIYTYSVQILQQNYLSGIGLGSFQAKVDELSKDNLAFRTFGLPYALHPHNLFLSVWLSTGLIGIVVFLYGLFQFFYLGFKERHSLVAIPAVSAMVAIIIHGLFDTTYFKNDLSAIFWLAVAFIGIIIRHEDNFKQT